MPDAPVARAERKLRRLTNHNLRIGGVLIAIFILLAVFGAALAPQDPEAQDLLALLDPPSAAHLFGTDNVGRDILSRIIAGTRYTLSVAIASVCIAGVCGIALGSVAGYFGGLTDRVVTGVIDLLLTVPNIVLAIAIASVAGSSATGLTIAITASFIPPLARLIRGRVQEIAAEDFVAACVNVGMSHGRILLRHVLPNAATVMVIELSLNAGQAVLIGSALGFLGLGVQPPAPEWGTMLGASREYLTIAPHIVLAPGIAISLLVLAFNLLGDGLRDLLDPNTRT
jgi:ABC-type dipeptide/oligopeptide/nickel transport system permease subunit